MERSELYVAISDLAGIMSSHVVNEHGYALFTQQKFLLSNKKFWAIRIEMIPSILLVQNKPLRDLDDESLIVRIGAGYLDDKLWSWDLIGPDRATYKHTEPIPLEANWPWQTMKKTEFISRALEVYYNCARPDLRGLSARLCDSCPWLSQCIGTALA